MLQKTQEVLEFIANDELFENNDIRFVGGTALSYLIEHRLSEDLDFASLEVSSEEIEEVMKKYGAEKLEHDSTQEDYVTNEGGDINSHYIKFMLKGVKVGRIQVFNNWSPYMIENPDKIWIGLEYFCNVGDEIWSLEEDELKEFAINELVKIDLIDKKDVIDSTVIKVEKAYPAYFGSYDNFDEIKKYINTIKNLYCVGRNGMHRYNNMDHSMLSAMQAVKNIQNNIKSKDNIWSVNTEEEYHESK